MAPESAPPEADVRRAPYAVAGGTVAQLAACVAQLGPARDGRRYGAFTDWRVRWSFAPRAVDGGWAAGDARVRVTAVVRVPAWRAPPGTEPAVVEAWERYRAALEAHEGGHVEIAKRAGAEALLALRALPAAPTREACEARARAAVDAAVREAREREEAYDRETQHGAAQGATLG